MPGIEPQVVEPLAAAGNANYLFLLGMVLVTATLLRRVYRRRRVRRGRGKLKGTVKFRLSSATSPKHRRSPASKRSAVSPLAVAEPMPAEMRGWEVHMHETARELSARLDSKIVVLEQLLTSVERERHRVESLLASLPPAAAQSGSSKSGRSEPPAPGPEQPPQKREKPPRRKPPKREGSPQEPELPFPVAVPPPPPPEETS